METTAATHVLLGSAKIAIKAVTARVFEALVQPEDVQSWWSQELTIEGEVGGRYVTNPPEGRQEGVIVALEAPRRLTFTWPVVEDSETIETLVTYELSPKGDETLVNVAHRAPRLLSRDWNDTWRRALESLRSYLEGQQEGGP